MKQFIKTLWQDESGQDLAEYALLLGLIAVALVGAIVLLRDAISDRFDEAATELDGAGGGGAGGGGEGGGGG